MRGELAVAFFLEPTTPEDEGEFTVTAKNAAGEATCTTKLSCVGKSQSKFSLFNIFNVILGHNSVLWVLWIRYWNFGAVLYVCTLINFAYSVETFW